MQLADLERPSFGGHETFPFRYTWLKKAYDAVGKDKKVFISDDALVTLGVGKNMVRSMRHWALSCGILAEPADFQKKRSGVLQRGPLGERLFAAEGWDPYLEDPGTLWLLHWQVCSAPDTCSTWWFAFSELGETRFTRQLILDRLMALVRAKHWPKVSEASLKRDVDAFVRSYVSSFGVRTKAVEDYLDCPLVELRLIREGALPGAYEFVRSPHPSLPDEVFAFALAAFIKRRNATATIAAEEIHYAPGSPGRVFLLDDAGLFTRLERMKAITRGAWTFDDTAGVRQLQIHREVADPLELLNTYFASERDS